MSTKFARQKSSKDELKKDLQNKLQYNFFLFFFRFEHVIKLRQSPTCAISSTLIRIPQNDVVTNRVYTASSWTLHCFIRKAIFILKKTVVIEYRFDYNQSNV